MRLGELDGRSSQYLAQLLQDPVFEVLPLASSLQHARHLTAGARVNVAASPRRGLEATIGVAAQQEAAGFRAVPHLAERMVRDHSHLRELLDRLADAGIPRAFVVAGDAAGSGPFPSGLSLLREIAELERRPTEIGIPGYPQGHPFIPAHELRAASHRSTGVVHAPKLLTISARIGVSDAARFVLRHGSLISRLLRPRGYRPEPLVKQLVPGLLATDAAVQRLHFYTFNQVTETEVWRRRSLSALRQRGARAS